MVNGRYRRTIERLYTDRATIYRFDKVKDPITKETKLDRQLLYADQPCRISRLNRAENDQTIAQNDIKYESLLFVAPELGLQQGDELVVTRGRIAPAGWEPIAPPRKYEAGEPFVYSTHQEISLQRKEWV